MRIRHLLVVAVLALGSLGLGAAPASACQPDVPGGCCADDPPNVLWRKLTGNDLYQCPW